MFIIFIFHQVVLSYILQSREFHEKGKRHQENVKKKIDEVSLRTLVHSDAQVFCYKVKFVQLLKYQFVSVSLITYVLMINWVGCENAK